MATGGQYVGETVNCTSPGTWTNSPTSYTYQWERGSSEIAGATSAAYTLTVDDMGANIDCQVTAHNAGGSSLPAISNSATTKTAALTNTSVPVVTDDGGGYTPTTLAVTPGSWDSNPPGPTYAYQWYLNSTFISGATSATHYDHDTPGDYYCEVTAFNSAYPSGVAQNSNTLTIG
jgi:hypothetical protein